MSIISTVFSFSQISNSTIHFSHVNTKTGLQSDYVNAIIQDRNGLMWFGTANGLFNFDGQSIHSYLFDFTDSTTISGNMVQSFLIDNENNIWVGTNFGLCTFIKNKNNFKRIRSSASFNQRNSIIDLKLITTNQIIVSSPSNILIYNKKTEVLDEFMYIKNIIGIKDNERFSKIFFDGSNRLWVCTQSRFIIFNWPDKQYTSINHNCGIIRNVYQPNATNVWISSTNGLFVLNTNSNLIKNFEIKTYKNQPILEIWDTKLDHAGNLWIGTNQQGLIKYNIEKQTSSYFTYNEFDPDGLSNNNIRSIYTDRQGIVWIGTQYKGVSYAFIDNIKKFNTIYKVPGATNLLSSDIIAAILEDSDGNLWLGTDGYGLNLIKKENGKVIQYSKEQNIPQGLSTNAILSIFEDHEKNIWIGGYRSYITKYNLVTKQWKNYPNCILNNGNPVTLDIRKFFEDSKNRIWIATNGQGLFRYNREKESFTNYNSSNSGVIDDYMLTIEENQDHKLWLGTYYGACIFNPESPGEKIYFWNELKDSTSLSNNWVYCIHKDKMGTIWLGTAFGLNQYNPQTNKFYRYNNTDIFPGKEIYGILEDGSNDELWISTNYGLTRLNPVTLAYKNYFQEDGLPSSIFIKGSYFKNKNNSFYFGTSDGLVYFSPYEIKTDTFSPPVIISDIQIFYKSIYQKKFNNENKLIFNYQQSTITFKYVGLNYIMNSRNTYMYKLEGYNRKWNNVGNRNETTFTNLDPGKYTFRVKATNQDGFSSDQEAIINFVISPPWWKTLWFRLTIIILFISFLLLILRLRTFRINNQKDHLEEIIKQRTTELTEKHEQLQKNANELNCANELLIERQTQIEKQSEEILEVNQKLNSSNCMKDKLFSIIAHDLKNPFNSILGFTEMLKNPNEELTSETRDEYISIIHSASRKVYDLLDNLLIWGRSQMKKIAYEPIKYNLTDQIYDNINFYKEMYTRKKLEINLHTSNIFFVFADSNMINTVIRNLLSNAIKFTSEGGRIDIYLTENENSISCAIKDTGIGIERGLLNQLLQTDNNLSTDGTLGERGTGLGLIICSDFINRNFGKIWAESCLNMGTSFYFSIPKA